jgi:tetratricopeptide (TPR) repeat protein
MLRNFCTILFLFALIKGTCFAQFSRKVDSLVSICNNNAADDKVKVEACGKLAELYYVYQLDVAGDSMLQRQVKIAELSGDRQLMLNAYFGNVITNITEWRSKESFDKALAFLNKGLAYAKTIASDEYLALAHARISNLYRKWGQTENALNSANAAVISALNTNNDSIKIIANIEQGDAYRAMNDALRAFKIYTKAYEEAVKVKNRVLQSEINHRLAELYKGLDYPEFSQTGLDYLLENEKQNKEYNYTEGLIKDYIDLARLTDEKSYILKAIHLADSLHWDKYKLQTRKIMYGFYAYKIGNADSTFRYINENEDLKLFFGNRGKPSFYYTAGSIHQYSGNIDSAIYYYQKALPGLDTAFDLNSRQGVYIYLGQCFEKKGLSAEAVEYYQKAYFIANNLKNLSLAASCTKALSDLYEKTGDFKNAIVYYKKNERIKDSLAELSSQRDIALAEINNVKRNHENELVKQEKKKIDQRNLQYMAITILIGLFFITLIVLGMFPLNKLTIKLSGFFVFICLFEFIVLLIDSWLHRIAHGEPLKVWLMKIFIIALLVPCQHFLERQMVKFIESAKLHKLRLKLVEKTNKKRTKRSAEEKFDDMENDSAVL